MFDKNDKNVFKVRFVMQMGKYYKESASGTI